MRRSTGKGRGLLAAGIAVGLGFAGLAAARPAAAQDCTGIAPYVFILFDTSGSMNWAPPCSQAEVDAGFCAWRCDQYDCWVPQMADSPSSKFYQVKQALYDVVSNTTGVQFGFATFNQDALNVRSKHWTYEATGSGVNIPGWGAFPGTGTREVFGNLWTCNTGSGNNQVGCAAATPADLSDVWKRTRVQQLAKLGTNFNQAVTFYVRVVPSTYRVTYTPVFGATPGSAVNVTVLVAKCNNVSCSSTTTIGQTVVPFTPVDQFLAWDNGSSSSLSQTNPELTYFTQVVADASATNTCNGWEPNTDTTADQSGLYSLKWPTATDPRGTYYSFGDMIPQDWQTAHDADILKRMAPNSNPLAPDFRTSFYLIDRPTGGDTFLRLKDAIQRPLIASGSSPVSASVNAFRKWWSGCATGFCSTGWVNQAITQDPDWACRRQYLIVLSDGDETCASTPDACSEVSNLSSYYGIKTYAVGFGAALGVGAPGNKLACMAANGGTSAPYTPHLRQDLEDTLTSILNDIKAGI
jgi:hypothetical protein